VGPLQLICRKDVTIPEEGIAESLGVEIALQQPALIVHVPSVVVDVEVVIADVIDRRGSATRWGEKQEQDGGKYWTEPRYLATVDANTTRKRAQSSSSSKIGRRAFPRAVTW
jgi:hypothetical protein